MKRKSSTALSSMSTRTLALLVAGLMLGIALSLRWYLDAESEAHAATRPAAEPNPPCLVETASERTRIEAVLYTAPARRIPRCGGKPKAAEEEAVPEAVSEEAYGTPLRVLADPNS